MSDDIDLAQILGINREVAHVLAETSAEIARARNKNFLESENRAQSGQAIPSGQKIGQVNLSSLSPAEVGELQTATLATQAAVNLLIINQAESARALFGMASVLVEPYSTNDSVVLGTCANPRAAATGKRWGPEVIISPWVAEAIALLYYASESHRSVESLPSMGRFGAGASGEPPAGVSLSSLVDLRVALSRVTPRDGPRAWNSMDAGFHSLVLDATSRFSDFINEEWWANQTGSLFPLEPESLMLGLSHAIWLQRRSEFGPGYRDEPATTDLPHARLARAVTVAATRLLN